MHWNNYYHQVACGKNSPYIKFDAVCKLQFNIEMNYILWCRLVTWLCTRFWNTAQTMWQMLQTNPFITASEHMVNVTITSKSKGQNFMVNNHYLLASFQKFLQHDKWSSLSNSYQIRGIWLDFRSGETWQAWIDKPVIWLISGHYTSIVWQDVIHSIYSLFTLRKPCSLLRRFFSSE